MYVIALGTSANTAVERRWFVVQSMNMSCARGSAFGDDLPHPQPRMAPGTHPHTTTTGTTTIVKLFGLENHCLPAHRKENVNAPKTHCPIVANFKGAHQDCEIRQLLCVVVKQDEGAGERKREDAQHSEVGHEHSKESGWLVRPVLV